MNKQMTLGKEVSLSGVGLHSGAQAKVILRPGKVNSGVVFKVPGSEFKLAVDGTKGMVMSTRVEDARGNGVATVEHLMSALHALGVDNVVIEVDGPEVPILDGSALPWVELIDAAGRVELEKERNWLKVEKMVVWEGEGRILAAEPEPRAGLWMECHVEFAHPVIGKQSWRGRVDEDVYRREIAPARTFVMEKDIEAARAAGLIKGGSLDCAVVYGEDGTVKNPEGLRFKDEAVRHKVLDAVGDLFMDGRLVWGKFALTAPGHSGNNQLLRKLVGI